MSLDVATNNLTVAYGSTTVIPNLSVRFPAGQITSIIGPNGCGKSTLLKALSRLMPSQSTDLTVGGKDVRRMRRKELATLVAVLPQTPTAPEGLIVADLVSRGRHPYQSWINQWSRTDEEEVLRALELTNSVELAERSVDELSGGQRQRVWISMVLAQDTDVLFLDEPTTYLDLSHSVDILNLVAQLKRDSQRTIVMVLHDLNLAIRYSDNLVVMKDGTVIATGTPAEVITPELLLDVFGLDAVVIDDPVTGGPLIVPTGE